jgi:hypothetical protein
MNAHYTRGGPQKWSQIRQIDEFPRGNVAKEVWRRRESNRYLNLCGAFLTAFSMVIELQKVAYI